MRTEFIQTKVCPIKKLFILGESDSQSFIRIIRNLSSQIDTIQNLILLNNEDQSRGGDGC
jgi:hypothetical protein